ncbi:MAG: glycosyltransferase family 4 protein [Bacteroidales bacterium]|nr:glycosyltransferase family 4 protein [Bacteroidales bacterium]
MDDIKCAVIGLRGFPGVQGGVEKHCEALYPLMKGFRFTVFRRKPYIPQGAAKDWMGIRFIDFSSTRLKGFEALFHTFISAIRAIALRPDIVHIHNIGPAIFAPLIRMAGIKVVTTYHSANYEHSKWGPIGRSILRFGERMALGFSNHIIFVNRAKYEAQSANVKARSSLIPNGVNTAITSASTSYLESLGLKPGEYYLGVGRLTPEKGFEHLVEAVQDNPDVGKLVIAGGSDHDHEYAERLKALDRKGKVIFTGNLQGEPLRQLYTHARAFVLSSVTEGFPLVLLEAMSYHLPVLVSRIEATEQIDFIPQESFFTAASPQSLSAAMTALEKRMAPGCRIDYPLDGYEWQSVADRTAKLFRTLTRPE